VAVSLRVGANLRSLSVAVPFGCVKMQTSAPCRSRFRLGVCRLKAACPGQESGGAESALPAGCAHCRRPISIRVFVAENFAEAQLCSMK